MLERTEAATWEELVVARLFEPLGLETAGFGPQSSVGRVDAPLGNLVLTDGTLKAILAGPNADNPLIHGPAGTVHCSILDFAVWAGWNAGEGWRGPALVSPETLRKLHKSSICRHNLRPRPVILTHRRKVDTRSAGSSGSSRSRPSRSCGTTEPIQ